MDFAYCKSFIEDFFKKNKSLFFPNDKYSEEDMKKACFDYCQKLCIELVHWERETERLDCSDLWMNKIDNDEIWKIHLDRMSEEQYNAVCKETDCHEYLISFKNYTLNRNNFTNPTSEQLLSVFVPSLGIKKEDTALKKVGKVVGFWGHWAKDIFTAQKRCCLSNCEKLLKEVGYFNKNK